MNAIDLDKVREIFETVIGSEIFAFGDYDYTGAYGYDTECMVVCDDEYKDCKDSCDNNDTACSVACKEVYEACKDSCDFYLRAYTVCPHDPDPDATCAGTCAEEDPANFICFNRIPIGYENVPAVTEERTAHAHVTIIEGRARAVSCGSNVIRRYSGVVIISIFQAVGGGSSLLRLIATRLNDRILSAYVPSSLSIRTPFFGIIGKSGDWFQGNLTIPFEFDQLTH